MEKVFEALERLKTAPSFMGGTKEYMFAMQSERALLEDYELVKQAIIELKEIKESNPSEALKCLKELETNRIEYNEGFELGFTKTMPFKSTMEYKIIHQALLKAEKLEKVCNIVREKVMPLVSIDDGYIWDNELYQSIALTQEEADLLKEVLE